MSSNNEILKLLAMLKQQQTTASQGAYQNLVSQHPPANDNATQALLSKSRTNSNFTIPVNSTDILSQALNCQPTNSVVTHQQQQLLVLLNTLSSVNTKTATELAGYGCVQQPESSPQIQKVQSDGLMRQHFQGQMRQQQFQTAPPQQETNSQSQLQGAYSQQQQNSQAQKLSRAPSTAINHTAGLNQNNQDSSRVSSNNLSIPSQLSPKPLDIHTLQTYNLKQLESYATQLKERNQPIPNHLKLLLEHEQQKEAKRVSKRISNRKSATKSRNRQRGLIESLLAENKRLRRNALILSHIPDAVVAIGVDGTIKFCNAQMSRITKHKEHDLVGHSIRDFLTSGSWRPLRHLIRDMQYAERIAAGKSWVHSDSTDSDGQTSSESCIIDDNGTSISTRRESSYASESTNLVSSKTGKCNESGNHDRNCDTLPFKKRKTNYDISLSFEMDVSDVMSDSVTSNNADRKLSSLDHPKSTPPKGNNLKRQWAMPQKDDTKECYSLMKHTRSKSSSNSNVDSYTAESSGDSTEDSSSLAKNSIEVDKQSFLAPSCMVEMIRKDLLPILCRVTFSIRTRTVGDVDCNLGFTDPANKYSGEPSERELLLCFRPVCIDLKVRRDSLLHHQISRSSIANEENKESDNICTENSSLTNQE